MLICSDTNSSIFLKIMKGLFSTIVGFLIVAIAGLGGCDNKNANEGFNLIPDVRVSRSLNIRQPNYSDLSQPGGHVYLPNEGYRGILVVRNFDNEFHAFDRACPTAPDRDCAKLTMHESNLFIGCGQYVDSQWQPCTPSQYNLDGSIKTGPSDQEPKAYSITQEGSNLRIFNRAQ